MRDDDALGPVEPDSRYGPLPDGYGLAAQWDDLRVLVHEDGGLAIQAQGATDSRMLIRISADECDWLIAQALPAGSELAAATINAGASGMVIR